MNCQMLEMKHIQNVTKLKTIGIMYIQQKTALNEN